MADEIKQDETPNNALSTATAGARTATDTAVPDPAPGGAEAATPEFEADPVESGDARDDTAAGASERSIEALLNVDLDVSVILGHSKMPISTLLKLSRGSVIELEQRIGEPVRIVVNNKVVARGELIKLNGDRLGVSLTEIVREHMSTD